jgi:flagellar M-ring protein FliF
VSKVASILQNFNELWRRTGLVQRVLLVGILLACIGASTVLVGWARKPSYSLLYAGLSPEEAAQIVEKARDEGIAHVVKDGGTTVYVASDKVYELRLKMASQGLPGGSHEGYRILDQEKIGTSPFVQKVNHVRAVEGELAKSIETLDSVDAARVHVVPAESKLFNASENEATATAVLRLRGGRLLAPRNVAAIVHLLAGGVEGLRPGNVTVIDSQGNLLSGDNDDPLTRGVRSVLDQKVQAEQYLARKAEQMLETVLGPGRATVQVSVTLETTSTEETTEKPLEGVATRERIETKSTTPAAGAEGQGGGGATKESTTETEMIAGRTVSKKVGLPGSVTSVSVSCFVDLSAPEAAEGEEAAQAGPLLQVADVEAMIRNALGLTETDPLKVVDTPFHQDQTALLDTTEAEETGLMSPAFLLDMGRRLSVGILVIGALLALKLVRRSGRSSGAGGEQVAVEGAGAGGERLLTGGAMSGNRDALRSQISRALQENPEEVKRLFLSWVENGQAEE